MHLHLLVGNTELFRGDQRHGGPCAAHIDGTHGQVHRAVHADVQIGAGLAAEVEPEAAGHAAALVLAELGLHVRMILYRP